jgi:hypothetical protein
LNRTRNWSSAPSITVVSVSTIGGKLLRICDEM